MRKSKFIAIIAGIILLSVVVIPVAINESYKHGVVYITKWDAADVLSYYGTVLGAVATTSAMVITITFTYKQIRRDSYLKTENEKWMKIESAFANVLDNINPIRLLMETMDTSFTNPSAAIGIIQKYQIACQTATDVLNGYLNIVDYPKVKPIVDTIGGFREEISQVLQDLIIEYSKLRDFSSRNTAKRTIEMENKYPNSFSTEDIAFSEKILKDTNGIQQSDIEKAIEQLNEKIIAIYYGAYRSLLQLKGSTFETINAETQKKADSILHLWGKS